jgi:DNA primase
VTDVWVDRVREAVDLVEIVSEVVELRRAGTSYKGLCPFHQEKTPSFVVHPDRQLYHCFGCGAGGDVFSFVMATQGLTFPEALQELARRAGIRLPAARGSRGAEELERVVEAAQAFFVETLRGRQGAAARAYLERRGIPPEIQEAYGVGFAPPGWRHLTEHLARRFPMEALVAAGVTVRPEGGKNPYDRFRNRITFPVRRPSGRVVGFGARALGEEEPKYLNSPEGALYRKSDLLFGLSQAREALRREKVGILVEGYFDVLGLARAGIGSAVAPCGTALTPRQGAILKRSAPRWILFFDGDPAGLKATWKALEVLVPLGVRLRIVPAAGPEDPDDLARRLGAEVRHLLDEALDPIAWLARLGQGEARRAWLLDRVATLLSWVRDPVVEQVWLEQAARRLRVPEETLRAAVRSRRGGGRPAPVRREAGSGSRADLRPLERDVLLLALEQPEVAGELARAAEGVPAIREPVRTLLADWPGGGGQGMAAWVARTLEQAGIQGVTETLVAPGPGYATEEMRRGVLRRLQRERLRVALEGVGRRLREAEARGGAELARLLEEKQRLAAELERLEGE